MREGYLATTYYRGSMHKDNMRFFDDLASAQKYIDVFDECVGDRCVWHLTATGAKLIYKK